MRRKEMGLRKRLKDFFLEGSSVKEDERSEGKRERAERQTP